MHALSSIRKHSTLNRLRPNTASQIFDTMIFPILSYNSEIWGMCTKQDFKTWDRSPIEKSRAGEKIKCKSFNGRMVKRSILSSFT